MKYKLTARELSDFCGQLALLVHSGISATEGINILLEESRTDTDKEVLGSLLKHMEESGSLSQAMKETGFFPDSVVAYTRTGEETGCLDEIMESLSTHYDQEQEISDQIRSAVAYPLIMLGMMGVVILVLLIKVLPVFQQVFNQMGMEINELSRGLLNMGNVISRYSAAFFVFAVILICCVLFFSLTAKGRSCLICAVVHLPVVRDIPVSLDYGRMAQGLSLGLKSGLSPETSLALASQMISHPLVLERLKKTADLLDQGEAFATALTGSGLFDGMEGRLVSISFQSGSADEALARLSVKYQENSIGLISRIISIVEPTIVILLSLLVGLVLLSVMMPLLGILSDIVM